MPSPRYSGSSAVAAAHAPANAASTTPAAPARCALRFVRLIRPLPWPGRCVLRGAGPASRVSTPIFGVEHQVIGVELDRELRSLREVPRRALVFDIPTRHSDQRLVRAGHPVELAVQEFFEPAHNGVGPLCPPCDAGVASQLFFRSTPFFPASAPVSSSCHRYASATR